MNNNWKPLIGYDGLYSANEDGSIRSDEKVISYITNGKKINRKLPMRILKPYSDKDGYLQVGLSKGGLSKTQIAHRLIFAAFNGFLPLEVNHIDGNKKNNRPINLEESDRIRNAKHAKDNNFYVTAEKHKNSKLTNLQVSEIVNRLVYSSVSINKISKDYPCSNTIISHINTGKAWRTVTKSLVHDFPIRRRK